MRRSQTEPAQETEAGPDEKQARLGPGQCSRGGEE
jgi:hypothetical protein